MGDGTCYEQPARIVGSMEGHLILEALDYKNNNYSGGFTHCYLSI